MNCVHCLKEILNKGSLVKHQNGCKLNPNRIVYKSNFVKYNEKVRKGEVQKNSNQWTKAKKEGRQIILSEATRYKIGSGNRGKHLSVQQKEHLSLIRSKVLEETGMGGFKHIKWFKVSNIKGEEFIVRGTWELKVAELLNSNGVLWVRKLYLKYKDTDGVIRTYTPDFYIPTLNRYLEVKGYFSEKDQIKLRFVTQQNSITLLLIQGKDFKEGLLENIQALVSPLSYT